MIRATVRIWPCGPSKDSPRTVSSTFGKGGAPSIGKCPTAGDRPSMHQSTTSAWLLATNAYRSQRAEDVISLSDAMR